MRKKELTISDKLDIIAMQPMTRETMKFICEIDEEVNLKDYKLRKYKIVLDKIKEIMNTTPDTNYSYDYVILKNEIYKLLEEIE